MIEDALVEANRLEEASVVAGIKKGINAVANAFTGKNGQQPQEQSQQNITLDTIKGYLKDNPDPSDWPVDRLKDLVAFLKTQKDFMNSKKAQAALQAIQQQENEANAEGKVSSDSESGNTSGAGDATALDKYGNSKDLIVNDINRHITIYKVNVDDLIAYLQTLKK